MDLDALRATLLSDGWKTVMEPVLQEQQRAALNQLTILQDGRPVPNGWRGAPGDDYLRGFFAGLSFALNHWQTIINESEAAQSRREEEARQQAAPPLGSPYADPTKEQPLDASS